MVRVDWLGGGWCYEAWKLRWEGSRLRSGDVRFERLAGVLSFPSGLVTRVPPTKVELGEMS